MSKDNKSQTVFVKNIKWEIAKRPFSCLLQNRNKNENTYY